MKTTSSNYDTQNAAENSNPVWIAIFPDLPTASGLHCSNDFLSMDADYQKTIIGLNYRSISIDRLEPSTDLSNEYEIVFQDQTLAFTSAISTDNILGREVTIKLGFAEIAEADFITLPTLTVTEVELQPDLLSWRVRAKDVLFNLNQKVFRSLPQNLLNGDIVTGAATITVDSTTGFRDPTSPALPSYIKTCIIIDNEIKSYTGLTGTTFTGCATIGNTGDVDHFDNAQVKQAYAFCCDPLTAALHVLMTTDGGANGFYDLNIDGFGLGVSSSLVNYSAIERLGYKLFNIQEYSDLTTPSMAFLFATQEEDGLQWIEGSCLAPGLCYFFVNSSGQLDVDAIDNFWLLQNWAADDTVNNADIHGANFRFGDIVNWVETKYNKIPTTGNFTKQLQVELDDSVSEYGRTPSPFVYQMHGNAFNDVLLSSGTPGYFYWARRVFNSYGDITGKITLQTTYRKLVLDVNDKIQITFDQFPDLVNGTRGWSSKKAIITRMNIDFSGLVTIEADTHELYTKLDQLTGDNWTVNEVVQGSIDDTSVAYDTDKTMTVQAADAYFDNTAESYDADLVVFFVEIAEQAGSVANATIGLRLQVFYNGPNLITADDKSYIRYSPVGTATPTIPFYLWVTNSNSSIIKAKVDWFYHSETDAAEHPVITLKKLWFVTFNRAMSLS